MTNGSKNQKNNFLLPFNPIVRAWVSSNEVEDTHCDNLLWEVFVCLSPIFQGYISLDW